MIKTYKDLEVYKKSYEMCLLMYKYTRELPTEERYGLTSQIKRASTSIPLNIAEGYGKKSSINEFKRFLLMALGSCNEMNVLLDLCRDLGYLSYAKHKSYESEYQSIGKMLSGLIKRWQ